MGMAGIIGGNAAEGHSVANLLNAAAPIIVFGGSFGAAILQFTPAVLKRAALDL
jgi:chemotaxis protein MotA